MDRAEAQEYSESIAQIGHGFWRQIAWAGRQGIPEALGMTWRQWGEAYHGYLSLPIPERRAAVAELQREGFSRRETADALGVDPSTVAGDRRANRGVENPTRYRPSPPARAIASVENPTLTRPEAQGMIDRANDRPDAQRAWDALRTANERLLSVRDALRNGVTLGGLSVSAIATFMELAAELQKRFEEMRLWAVLALSP